MRLPRILLLVASLTLTTGSALGQTFDAALEAYERGDYAAAAENFGPLAEQGNAGAQYNLGIM